jgi:hypothetical protein
MLAGNWWTLLLRGIIAAVLFLGFRVRGHRQASSRVS